MKPSNDLKREVTKDKNAQSINEICKEVALSEATVRRHAKRMVASGIWKELWRKDSVCGYIKVYIKVK